MNMSKKKIMFQLSISLLIVVSIFNNTVFAQFPQDNPVFLPSIHSLSPYNTFYLSPSGNDSHSGVKESEAWATFDHAWNFLFPGDTLILMDGIYHQSLFPNVRDGEPGKPITIRAKNDGKAVIEGDDVRVPVKLGQWANPGIGNYFTIEGIIAQNSSEEVYIIWGSNNTLRRVSGYNANKDQNTHVFTIAEAHNNLIEDCVASGTGRKMVLIWGGSHNTIRRCFTNWVRYDARFFPYWPWGEDLEIYNGSNNIIENSISYGSPPQTAVSLYANIDSANGSNPYSNDNKILGVMAIQNGVFKDGTFWEWGVTRPQPTDETVVNESHLWAGSQIGFGTIMWGEQSLIKNTLYQDIFSYQNAGLGFSEYANYDQKSVNTIMNRATIINNGLNAPSGDGGPGTNVKIDQFSHYTITNSRIGGTSYNGEGAKFIHRYVDGVLQDGTNGTSAEFLWPWPMQNRVLTELGVDVTGEITETLQNNNTPTGKNLANPQISPLPIGTVNEISSVPYNQTYIQPVTVTITSPVAGSIIRYTLDGSEPSAYSLIYSSPLIIDKTSILKAKIFLGGQESFSRSAYYRISTNAINLPPKILADALPFRYPYIDIMLPNNEVEVYGLATDDTLTNSGSLTTIWSQVSGPGNVSFGHASRPRTSVTFPNKSGLYILRMTVTDGMLSSSKDVTVHVWPEDNVGTVFTIPGRIDAVNFKSGGEGTGFHEEAFSYGGPYRPGLASQDVAYNDLYGYAISDIAPGDWFAYDINVLTAGNYILDLRISSGVPGGAIHLETRTTSGNVTNITGSITIPDTINRKNFISIEKIVYLPQGQYELRLVGDQPAPGEAQTYTLVHYMEFKLK